MRQKIFSATGLFMVFSVLIIFNFYPHTVRAESMVTQDTINTNERWVKSSSPYILGTDVWIKKGVTLTIDPGVTIMSASTSDPTDKKTFSINGTLNIKGSSSQPVTISGLGLIAGTGASVSSTYANFINTSGIDLSTSTLSMSSTTISGAGIGLGLRGSKALIQGSVFRSNRYGLRSMVWSANPVITSVGGTVDGADGDLEIGGEGNAINTSLNPTQNDIIVTNSVFENNQSYGIHNSTVNTIDAMGNWWGSTNGPRLLSTGAGDRIFGLMSTSPWLTATPPQDEVTPECCSSVIFLPGLQASRLYRDEGGLFGTTTNRLWEPNRNLDVEKLYLDSDGVSIDPEIYDDGVIDSVFGFKIYDSFIKMMDSMVADSTMSEWTPYSYDWRKSASDMASVDLINKIEDLATRSKTGKVSIVTHSNGGLVAKALADKMYSSGKSDLVDKIVMVSAPELGTPQAIAGILHGDNQSIAGGLILSSATARELGRTMPGAYGLLPSRSFMDNFLRPIISYAQASEVTPPTSGNTISTYQSLRDFLLGNSDGRQDPDKSDIDTPSVLKESILIAGEVMHSLIDNLNQPILPNIVSLIGWGKKTLESIKYTSRGPTYEKTMLGDGTVHVFSSDQSSHNKNIFFDVGKFNADNDADISHADILEAEPVLSTIKSHLESADISTDDSKYISSELPSIAYRDDDITVGVHSPASIDLYDSQGRHTGFVDVSGTSPGSDLLKKEEKVPGSTIDMIGESKYISVTPNEGQEYTFSISGTGVGTMTVDIARRVGGSEKDLIEYVDIPVTPYLSASLSIPSSFTYSDATSTMPLNIDIGGDGVYDASSYPSDQASSTLMFATMRNVVELTVDDIKSREYLIKKIDNIEKKYEKSDTEHIVEELNKLTSKTSLGHFRDKDISSANKKLIAESISAMLDTLSAK